jgi:hypothetical protein
MAKIQDISPEKLREAIQKNRGYASILASLGIGRRCYSQQKILREFVERENICIEHFEWGVSLKKLNVIFSEATCFKEVAVMAGLCRKQSTMNSRLYKKLKDHAKYSGIDTGHFDSAGAKANGLAAIRFSEEEVFSFGSPVSRQTLKKRYLAQRSLGYFCDKCQISDWLGQPLALDLDHIDGDSTNNLLSNLRLLCPNCHCQTETYAGKNLKVSGTLENREKARQRRVSAFMEQKNTKKVSIPPVIKKTIKQKNTQRKSSSLPNDVLHQTRKELVLGSGVDLTRHGRNQELSKIFGIKPPKVSEWLKNHMPEEYALLKRKRLYG